MKVYYADTNIFLRYILQDNPKQAKIAEDYLSKAKAGKLKIVVASEVLPEIEYILRKVYAKTREDIARYLESIVKSSYLDVEIRDIWFVAIKKYARTNLDIVDILLYVKSRKGDAKILSFDKDFSRLARK